MNLFKKIVFGLILLMGNCYGFAQEISIRGGFNLSEMSIKWDGVTTFKNAKLMPGFHVGPIVALSKNNNIAFETGLLYSTKGFKEIGYRTVDQKSLFRLNIAYLEVPLTFSVSFPFKHITLLANGGGYIAQGLFGNILTKDDINANEREWQKIEWGHQENSFRRFDFGLSFGMGMKYKNLQFGICYENGIANLAGYDRSKSKVHNRVAELYFSHILWNKSKIKH